jgi:peptide/nickel transport system permease protein
VNLRLLPVSGTGTVLHLVLPTIALAAHPISKFTRLTRSEMLEVLSQDYVRTARAKGLAERVVRYRHALKNASIGLVTVVGLDIGYLLGGSVIVETVFAWPGIGRLMIDAISQRDFPVVQADVFVMATTVVVVNFLVDISYPLLDPRIRLQGAA